MRAAIAVAPLEHGEHRADPQQQVASGGQQRGHPGPVGPAVACRARGGGGRATANATPAPTWAITVDHAEPATPQSKPNTNTTSSTALTRLAASRIDERRAVVGGAALDALGAEGDEDERQADGADAQVGDGEVERPRRSPPSSAATSRAPTGDHRGERDADDRRQPHRLHADVGGLAGLRRRRAGGRPARSCRR